MELDFWVDQAPKRPKMDVVNELHVPLGRTGRCAEEKCNSERKEETDKVSANNCLGRELKLSEIFEVEGRLNGGGGRD